MSTWTCPPPMSQRDVLWDTHMSLLGCESTTPTDAVSRVVVGHETWFHSKIADFLGRKINDEGELGQASTERPSPTHQVVPLHPLRLTVLTKCIGTQ